MIKNFSQGTTTQAIAREWKHLRKKILKSGILEEVQENLARDYPDRNFVPQDQIRELLVRGIDQRMSKLSSDLIQYQQEGFPKKERSARSKIYKLQGLTCLLGLKMDFDQYIQ